MANNAALVRYAAPDPAYAPGTQHSGFIVEHTEAIPEISGVAYVMRHEASGARLMWLANADTNRSFTIGFKTPPADSTGVFHILEHSLLDGSEHFPVKEPFVHLLKSSMQTFLNALTYPDKTLYPVASTNVTDLENLMDVYLDAVLHPAIYYKRHIFEQEGWHYEVSGEGSERTLSYNGVVLNEMKGVYSDPDEVLFEAVNRALFPENPYRFSSGGDPRSIPKLTYEGFLDTHARHYQLSNSYTILYGDLDIERELAFVAKHFAGANDRSAAAPNPLPAQRPVNGGLTQVVMQTTPENASVGMAYVVPSPTRERTLALDILLDAIMGSNEAPLKRSLLEADLADDINLSFVSELLQPVVMFQLKGAHAGVAERFREVLEQTCRTLAEKGIARELLEASLAQAEFELRERDFAFFTEGIAFSTLALKSWLYDDERACEMLHYEDAIAHMKEGLDSGYFERLLDEVICNTTHCAEVELICGEEGAAAEEAAELAEKLAALSEDDICKIEADVAELREVQERPDSPDDIARLPLLELSDIGEATPEPAQAEVEAPWPLLRHEIDANGIDYIYYYFGLDCLAWDELPYVRVLCDVLGKLATERHSAPELDVLCELKLGSLSFFPETYATHATLDTAIPKLTVGVACLAENVADAAQLPSEIWATSDFSDGGRIRDTLLQRKISMEQGFMGSGHAAAMARVCAGYKRSALVDQKIDGVEEYLFLRDLLDNFDERLPELQDTLRNLAQRIFSADNLHVSFTGTEAELASWLKAAGDLCLSQTSGEAKLCIPDTVSHNEAFVVPGDVVFVAEGAPAPKGDFTYDGSWVVASRAITYDYLWNEVRVKGGAYGCGFRTKSDSLLTLYSYRDPAVDPTVERFDATGEWLSSWQPTDEEFRGYQIASVSGFDAPQKARAIARRQDSARFSSRPEGWRQTLRQGVLEATPSSVHALASQLKKLNEARSICVFGSKELIAQSKLDLDIVELMGGNEQN